MATQGDGTEMSDDMRAIIITRFGGPDVLELRTVPTPTPGLQQVLVRVHATAINRADLLQREGKYPAPPGVPADIPGMEYAGEIAATEFEGTVTGEGRESTYANAAPTAPIATATATRMRRRRRWTTSSVFSCGKLRSRPGASTW